MLATLVDAPFHREGWVYEEKYDGIRLLARKEGRRVSLITRNQIDRAADFPSITAALADLPAPTLVLDGEVVVFDAEKVSRFQLLQRRELGDGMDAPVFVAFDCLYARGRDLRAEPLRERRAVLERELTESKILRLARRLDPDGRRAFAEARTLGLEGVVAKDASSVYEVGTRARAWLKIKVRAEDEFVIGGYTAPGGARSHFGALLIGAWEGERLRYAGKVGTGFTERSLRDLIRRFRRLVRRTAPFAERITERAVTWLEPRLVAQIAYTEWTGDGRLRHPVFLGLRDDKSARDVRWPGKSQTA